MPNNTVCCLPNKRQMKVYTDLESMYKYWPHYAEYRTCNFSKNKQSFPHNNNRRQCYEIFRYFLIIVRCKNIFENFKDLNSTTIKDIYIVHTT